jgi:hypothetical protein
MSPVLVNLSGFQFGFLSDETGINIESMSRKYGAKKIRVPDKQGSARGKIYYDFTIDLQIDGEVSGNTGIMAATIGAVISIANTIFGFGITTGGVYVDEATVTYNREKLQMVSLRASVDPQIS